MHGYIQLQKGLFDLFSMFMHPILLGKIITFLMGFWLAFFWGIASAISLPVGAFIGDYNKSLAQLWDATALEMMQLLIA